MTVRICGRTWPTLYWQTESRCLILPSTRSVLSPRTLLSSGSSPREKIKRLERRGEPSQLRRDKWVDSLCMVVNTAVEGRNTGIKSQACISIHLDNLGYSMVPRNHWYLVSLKRRGIPQMRNHLGR